MPDRYFIDTNLLIYRYSQQDEDKRAIVARLLSSAECVVSVQVMNEFCNVIRRRFPAQFADIESVLREIHALLPIEELRLGGYLVRGADFPATWLSILRRLDSGLRKTARLSGRIE